MSAVDKASRRGHSMLPSSRPLGTGVRRWECSRCSAAAVEYDGQEFGLALELDCVGSKVA